jgi:DNA (cytosine-5)-methyltransferase 1
VKPRLLDLFCGEGGAAAGYVAAGFEVVGVDSNPKVKQRYLESGASAFDCADANDYPLDGFDAAHWSPPCKDHTDLAARSGGDGTGWMLPRAVARARASGLPFVVENVEGARRHMDGAVMLCGSMLGLGAWTPGTHRMVWRNLKRHRLFLTSFAVLTPPDMCSGRAVGGVYGTGGGGQMTRGFKFNLEQSRVAMAMPWASRDGVSQAIPPAYTQFLGEQLLAHLAVTA